MSMKSLSGEPVSMWLPEKYKKPNTSTYVQGVEVETDYIGIIPEGFDTILLPEAEYLMFQGRLLRRRIIARRSAPCRRRWTVMIRPSSATAGTMRTRASNSNPAVSADI